MNIAQANVPDNEPVKFVYPGIDYLKAQLKQAREWHAGITSGAIGGGPFNTEGLRLLVAARVRDLEILVEGKPTTQMPIRHHV